jgi:hypothetical protein
MGDGSDSTYMFTEVDSPRNAIPLLAETENDSGIAFMGLVHLEN